MMKIRYQTILSLVLISVILAAIVAGCAQPQPVDQQNTSFIAPKPDREQINELITPQEAFALIQESKNNPYFVIIDDRTPEQFKSGHIAGAINIPASSFTAGISNLDKNNIYLVYCMTGCGAGSGRMESLGFKEVYDIKGGLKAWKSDRLPLVKGTH